MKSLMITLSLLVLCGARGLAQENLYDFRTLERSTNLPDGIITDRSAVIVNVPVVSSDEYTSIGDSKPMVFKAHQAFTKMGIDPIVYINAFDLQGSAHSLQSYQSYLLQRGVKNLIFLTKKKNTYELLMAPFNQKETMVSNSTTVYYMAREHLTRLLIDTGREIRRIERKSTNFLPPVSPLVLSGLSIIEKEKIKRMPGQLRRSLLAVERFSRKPIPEGSSQAAIDHISAYNTKIDLANATLDSIMAKNYPFDYIVIDKMSNEEMLRKRYQFLLRSEFGSVETVLRRLEYDVQEDDHEMITIVPILPDQTLKKPYSINTLIYKFYIRQNITKNIHVGEWDAEAKWEDALINLIGNMRIAFDKQKR
ncbi:MAG: hypothetical protein AAF789_08785 [Bacteroidota bacterium]